MKGLKKVSGETKGLKGVHSPEYLQLHYDRKEDYAFAEYFYDIGHGSRSIYESKDIISCGFITDPMTMKEIEDRINETIAYQEACA